MKKFLISEEEKERILGMHKDATKRQYLGEQSTKPQSKQATKPQSNNGLNASEAKAIKLIQDKIEKGEQKPVVILPENPTIAYHQ